MTYEVENKYRIEDAGAIEKKLAALGCQFEATIVQRDQYFNHPARDFAETDEALRIRSVGDENCVTYKGPKIDTATKTRQEIEPAIGRGGKTANAMAAVFVALGFRPVRVVEKRRRLAELAWEGSCIEVALDQIDGLGDFVELETTAAEGQLEAARECLASLAKYLELGKPERRSYLELLLERD
jgi:adenylate cyclase class 2